VIGRTVFGNTQPIKCWHGDIMPVHHTSEGPRTTGGRHSFS